MAIEIVKAGTFTTIQDLGRRGWQAYGVSVGGAMDPLAAKLANIIVGNEESLGVLEWTLSGPTLKFLKPTVIALYGANMKPQLNGRLLDHGRPIPVQKDDILQFSYAQKGIRCYLAVKGGFDLPSILGSQSTDIKGEFGGFHGRPLKKGDRLPIKEVNVEGDFSWKLPQITFQMLERPVPIRYVRGRQYNWFSDEAKEQFLSSSFTITPQSDRMGYRLSGPAITLDSRRELLTEGTTFGTIQIPPDGQPIILMADRQPTGGYPKFGEVIPPDLSVLSQLRPGDEICFKEVSLQEAQQIYLEEGKILAEIRAACQLKWKESF